MKILITGGLGFVGRYLIRAFGGRHDLIIFDNRDKDIRKNYKIESYNLEVINDDISNIFNYPHLKDIDVVYHLAANSNLNAGYKEHIKHISDTKILLNFCEVENIRRFIYASSSAVYGDCGGENMWEDTTTTPNPKSIYGICKLAGEHLVRISNKIPQRIILRYFNIYGYENEKGVIYNITKAILEGRPIELNINSEHDIYNIPTRDFIHIKDVSNVNTFFGEHEGFPKKDFCEVYNVGTGHSIDILTLTKLIIDMMGAKKDYPIKYVGENPNDILQARASTDKLDRLFSMYGNKAAPPTPFMTIKEGFKNFC